MKSVQAFASKMIGSVEKVIVGKRQPLILALVAWLSEGHILLEDVPGVAKTMLARSLARSLGATFKRVQCTPDLLPTDVTGASIFNMKNSDFEFRPGPIFTNLLLADEINRTTPRTQAALLEAMAEGKVTVDGVTRDLQAPFLVIATQNPVDHEGTFPLPEAQLDRFLMKFSLGYPSMEDELQMLDKLQHGHPVEDLSAVSDAAELLACQKEVRSVHVDPKVRGYLLEIVHDSRHHDDVALGGSPRATLALFRASQAMAAIRGRNFVQPDDVKKIVGPIMNHRVILKPEARLRRRTTEQVVNEIVAQIAVPVLGGAAPA
ncbi:MAG: MoxR family ATPase [Pirellulaceae bacterium]|nr:MoxR family ATPase [Planctomycetales bacterium]